MNIDLQKKHRIVFTWAGEWEITQHTPEEVERMLNANRQRRAANGRFLARN
jgi:hypothetical protein